MTDLLICTSEVNCGRTWNQQIVILIRKWGMEFKRQAYALLQTLYKYPDSVPFCLAKHN